MHDSGSISANQAWLYRIGVVVANEFEKVFGYRPDVEVNKEYDGYTININAAYIPGDLDRKR